MVGGHHGCLSAWSYSHLTSGGPTEPQAAMEMVHQKIDTVFSTVPPVWVRQRAPYAGLDKSSCRIERMGTV